VSCPRPYPSPTFGVVRLMNHLRFRRSIKPTAGNRNKEKSAAEETPIEQVPSIAYGPKLGEVDFHQDGFNTEAKVAGMKYSSILRVIWG